MNAYQLVLVGSDSSENSVWEDVGAKLLRLQVNIGVSRNDPFPPFDKMNSGLVTMHRVENNLQGKTAQFK